MMAPAPGWSMWGSQRGSLWSPMQIGGFGLLTEQNSSVFVLESWWSAR
jgi:hypothetical protein